MRRFHVIVYVTFTSAAESFYCKEFTFLHKRILKHSFISAQPCETATKVRIVLIFFLLNYYCAIQRTEMA
jgi:hypothetical protein